MEGVLNYIYEMYIHKNHDLKLLILKQLALCIFPHVHIFILILLLMFLVLANTEFFKTVLSRGIIFRGHSDKPLVPEPMMPKFVTSYGVIRPELIDA